MGFDSKHGFAPPAVLLGLLLCPWMWGILECGGSNILQLMVVQQRAVIVEFLGDWNIKVGSQEIPGVTGKFGFGVQNEAGQRLTVLPRERAGHSKHPLPTTQEKTLHME